MIDSLDDKSTMRFADKMQPYIEQLMSEIWPGCTIKNLRQIGSPVHSLDKDCAVDLVVSRRSGCCITIQTKCRSHSWAHKIDATMQIRKDRRKPTLNGEWSKLAAQLYFYGWANSDEPTGFCLWYLLDVMKYQSIVESHGGLEEWGKEKGWIRDNMKHGISQFVAIPMKFLAAAVCASHETTPEAMRQGRLFDHLEFQC